MRWLPIPVLLLCACPAAPAPKAEAQPAAKAAKPATTSAAPAEPKSAETPDPTAETASGPTQPAWFSESAIPGATVIQPARAATVGAEVATSMLLELPAETTTEACEAAMRKRLEAEVAEVPAAVPGDKGRLMLQGKSADHSYTVVCGAGKDGRPTLFMSFSSAAAGPIR